MSDEPTYAPADIPEFGKHRVEGVSEADVVSFHSKVAAFQESAKILEEKQIDARIAIDNVNNLIELLRDGLELAMTVVSATAGAPGLDPSSSQALAGVSTKLSDVNAVSGQSCKLMDSIKGLLPTTCPKLKLLGGCNK